LIWGVTSLVFLSGMIIVIAIFFAFTGKAVPTAERLARLWQPAATDRKTGFGEKQKQKAQSLLMLLGKLFPGSGGKKGKGSPAQANRMMARAGIRRAGAAGMLKGAKLILTPSLVALVYFTGLYEYNPFTIPILAAAAGFFLPDFWLTHRIRVRQKLIRLALADALDLLVICVEAGLALDQALLRVAQELRITHPELSEELDLVTAEMRLGKTRIDALRELATRTGVEDIKGLVAMLIQTDRFGTSIAQSLRVHADDLRSKRRQRAEEAAAKTTVKMVPPLVFFIFPALFVVILGPAVITIMRQFSAK
jgi:tight adherence protein C